MNENNNESNESVQTKLLALVQSWAFEFSSERELRGIAEVYMKLKDEGVHFPSPTEDDLKEADSEDIEAFFNAHEDAACNPKTDRYVHNQFRVKKIIKNYF